MQKIWLVMYQSIVPFPVDYCDSKEAADFKLAEHQRTDDEPNKFFISCQYLFSLPKHKATPDESS